MPKIPKPFAAVPRPTDESSDGNYEENSQEIEALKREIFSTPSNHHTDMENQEKTATTLRVMYARLLTT